MKQISYLLLFCLGSIGLAAQEDAKFTVTVSTDSILLGNYFEVTFKLENSDGQNFQAPIFEDFEVVSGPNISNSMSMINGETTRSVAYSYYLKPRDVGDYYIAPASIQTNDGAFSTEPIAVQVVPNPEGIEVLPKQNRRFPSLFDNDPWFNQSPRSPHPKILPPDSKKDKKPKRKIYKT